MYFIDLRYISDTWSTIIGWINIIEWININCFGYSRVTHVCSLGKMCFSSELIKRNGFKRESYPFDWIFSSPEVILDCLNDDFACFLNRDLYTNHDYEPLERKCGHSEYNLAMFNHHNPKDYEKDYNYFVRCINRFRILLKSNEPKLFVMTIHNNREDTFEKTKQQIIDFNNNFKKYCCGEYYIFVVFHVLNDFLCHELVNHENITFCRIYNKSWSNGVDFYSISDTEYLDGIFKNNYLFDVKPLMVEGDV
jgi:hypothetical protein